MTGIGAGVVMLLAFVLLLRLALPHKDGTPSLVAAGEHRAAAFSVVLVMLLLIGIAAIFQSVI